MTEFFKQLKDLGEGFLESLQHNTKLSTIFDIYLEKVISLHLFPKKS